MTAQARPGVSVVIPVLNGAASLASCLEAVVAHADDRPLEVIVVDDGSTDGSAAILDAWVARADVRVLFGEGRGAAAALNRGLRAARHPIVCQVDQDVVVSAGWMRAVTAALDDPDVAAAQGVYVSAPGASVCARVMAWDLAQRYAAIASADTDHVCTGTTAYRASALHAVGLFDESLGYGYDNDMSYRLRGAGHRLVICSDARSVHHWRNDLWGYLRQQYGYGYGRLDLVAKHPHRMRGDAVSPAGMMAHPLVMALALASGLAAAGCAVVGASAVPFARVGTALLIGLVLERGVATARLTRRVRSPLVVALVPVHLARDIAWVCAMAMWTLRRACGASAAPFHSMRRAPATPERVSGPRVDAETEIPLAAGVLALIPSHNEGQNLRAVVTELRARHPRLPILVIDDGSTDDTAALLPELGVAYLQFPERLGIGSAMRAGIRYAVRAGFGCAVRIDGDGQHAPEDLARLVTLTQSDAVDLALGTRFPGPGRVPTRAGTLRRLLGACLSLGTGTRISDPTSGLYAMGPRALRLLAEHHPTGYPEPELRLFAHRNGLRMTEVTVRARRRLRGRTSLTTGRLVTAAARVLLALIVVPWRARVSGGA